VYEDDGFVKMRLDAATILRKMGGMTDPNVGFNGNIPAYYDRCLGPFLFEPYADDLVARLPSEPGVRVLELACGTGIVTGRLRRALPAGRQLVATDLSPAMIAIARAKLAGEDIHWRTADAIALPFKDAVFDAVICQFGFMFFPDPARGFSEARRVLRPGGTLLINVWSGLDENPAAGIAHAVLSRMFEDDPPQFLRVPFGSLDASTLRSLAELAGFASVAVHRVAVTGRADSARLVADGFAKGSPLSVDLIARGADLEVVSDAIERELLRHGGHPFRSPLSALVLAAS
jgi:ubiquinone/menaquinone biosynthesis C-methylase UbiE